MPFNQERKMRDIPRQPIYRFVVSIDGEKVSFNSVSGLNIPDDSEISLSNEALEITFHDGLLSNNNPLYQWLNHSSTDKVEKKDILVTLIKEAGGQLIASWSVINALPTKLSSPTADKNGNDIFVDEVSMIADSITMVAH
ncbi:phage tail protein [Vibrio caribbeanicus]|uniref:Phage tail protein n=1 Tax=Vibrio caribbeanicus ATCC BAA-2122 TaxID=796620 RepID=E3BL80_9VIBR|nr:phage tail protein [Vibrio caribbeanicus]EFP96176.1 hypothetical protein VIBC2010_03682 [Vibrio caribbeanicus ATCC BAA-2122]